MLQPIEPQKALSQVANDYARQNVFAEYLVSLSDNTLRTYLNQLEVFEQFISLYGGQDVRDMMTRADSWHGITWGLVEAFKAWLLSQGYAINTINLMITAVRVFAELATKAGVISQEDNALIQGVRGYSRKAGRNIDERRPVTRVGAKKATATVIEDTDAIALKDQPPTPQGRRDTLLICLLLDHGLRVGELAALTVGNFDLRAGTMTFYRRKVDKTQTHELSQDTMRALRRWVNARECPEHPEDKILRASLKGGELGAAGMTAGSINARVRHLGEVIGLDTLSPHDCRHYWATYYANKVGLFRLKEAGGWNSTRMVEVYINDSEIANDGMV